MATAQHMGCGGVRGVACKASQVSGNPTKEAQLEKMTKDSGFISALDESGGTSPKTLAAYGITDKDYKDDAEMMSMVHDLRAKIMTNERYKEGSIIGAILFEDTINRDVEGVPTASYLWVKKKVAQQFEYGKRTIAKGMIPILEPEVDITAKDKAEIEDLLLPELVAGLKTLGPDDKVIFKLSLPEKANLYL